MLRSRLGIRWVSLAAARTVRSARKSRARTDFCLRAGWLGHWLFPVVAVGSALASCATGRSDAESLNCPAPAPGSTCSLIFEQACCGSTTCVCDSNDDGTLGWDCSSNVGCPAVPPAQGTPCDLDAYCGYSSETAQCNSASSEGWGVFPVIVSPGITCGTPATDSGEVDGSDDATDSSPVGELDEADP